MSKRIFTFLILTALFLLCLVCASGCETQASGAQSGNVPSPAPQTAAPEVSAAPAASSAPASAPTPDAAESTAAVTADPPELSPQPETVPAAVTEPDPAPAPSPPPEPEATPEPESVPEDVYAGPDLAESEPVDDAFFADAAFIGNSLVDGLYLYGGLDRGSFYAATSASVVNVETTRNSLLESGDKGTLFEAMTEKDYEKIYILLGINEIGFEPDYFSRLYGGLLDRIRQAEPEADIYIMSLSPVTEKCSESSEVFNMERIDLYNEALYALAQEKECYYVDLCQALASEDGYLPEEDSTDGIHLIPEKYPDWAEYLRTHVKE